MDQGGGTDGGKLMSLPPLLSLEEPAAWLVGARACLRPRGWGGLARRKNLNLTWRDAPPLPALDPTAYNKSPVAHPP